MTQNLLAHPGTEVFDIRRIVSFPHATGQCRAWLTANLPDAEEVAARSTAEAVRQVAEAGEPALGRHRHGPGRRALRAARCWRPQIEDRVGNSTRFVLVGPHDAGHPGADGARQDQRGVLSVR